jgi:hypothetical protein
MGRPKKSGERANLAGAEGKEGQCPLGPAESKGGMVGWLGQRAKTERGEGIRRILFK